MYEKLLKHISKFGGSIIISQFNCTTLAQKIRHSYYTVCTEEKMSFIQLTTGDMFFSKAFKSISYRNNHIHRNYVQIKLLSRKVNQK